MKKFLVVLFLFPFVLDASETDLANLARSESRDSFLDELAESKTSPDSSGYQSLGSCTDEEDESRESDLESQEPEEERLVLTVDDAFASPSSCVNLLKHWRNVCCFGDCAGDKSPEMDRDSCGVTCCFECCDKEVCCKASRCMCGTVTCCVMTGVLGSLGIGTFIALLKAGVISGL